MSAQPKPHRVTVTISTESDVNGVTYENQRHLLTEGAFTAEELVAKHFAIDEAVSAAVREAMINLAAGGASPTGEGFVAAKERQGKGPK